MENERELSRMKSIREKAPNKSAQRKDESGGGARRDGDLLDAEKTGEDSILMGWKTEARRKRKRTKNDS